MTSDTKNVRLNGLQTVLIWQVSISFYFYFYQIYFILFFFFPYKYIFIIIFFFFIDLVVVVLLFLYFSFFFSTYTFNKTFIMTSFSSKLNRMRSVKLSFANNNNKKREQQPARHSTPELQRTVPSNNNFVETLRVLSTEAEQTQYNDVFDSFFFNDKRCQNRAFYMAGRLKTSLDYNPTKGSMRPSSSYGNLPSSLPAPKPSPSQSTPVVNTSSSNDHLKSAAPKHVDSFWRMITHRLYTLNYIMFVLPPDSKLRADVLNRIEADLAKWGDGQELYRRGGMEAYFAVKYALEKHSHHKKRKTLLEDAFEAERRMNGDKTARSGVERSVNPEMERLCEQARLIIEQCLESEGRLSHQVKDAMYVYHGMRANLMGVFDVHIELEEDRQLRHLLKDTVHQNQKPPYDNPFEDEDCIVREDEEDEDSGFYDHCSSSV
jgi:hypothetical protein